MTCVRHYRIKFIAILTGNIDKRSYILQNTCTINNDLFSQKNYRKSTVSFLKSSVCCRLRVTVFSYTEVYYTILCMYDGCIRH